MRNRLHPCKYRYFLSFNKPFNDFFETETTSFLSGRQVSWQINTKKIMTYKMRLKLTKTQLADFWTWFNDTLGQNANAFTCSAIGNGTYRFVSIPSPDDTNQTSRVLTMEIEEVF